MVCIYVFIRSIKCDDSMRISFVQIYVSQVKVKGKEDYNYLVICFNKCSRGVGER